MCKSIVWLCQYVYNSSVSTLSLLSSTFVLCVFVTVSNSNFSPSSSSSSSPRCQTLFHGTCRPASRVGNGTKQL